jgi:ribose/xylose/arabinose/galactoside ABC-type transport system permease subunit
MEGETVSSIEDSQKEFGAAASKPPLDAAQSGSGWSLSEVLIGSATLVAFLIIIFGVFGGWLGHEFLNQTSLTFDIYQNVPVLLISTGVMIALSSGQFDLSAGSLATLCVFLTVGLTVNQKLTMGLVIPVVLLVGVGAGLFNAFLVNGLKLNPFIATLGTGGVFVGLYTLYANGTEISFSQTPAGEHASLWFAGTKGLGSFQHKASGIVIWIILALMLLAAWSVISLQFRHGNKWMVRGVSAVVGAAIVGGLAWSHLVSYMSWTIVILLGVALGVWALLRLTRFGRQLYATGGNPVAAMLAGIKVNRITTLAFVASGFFASLAGIILAADQGTAVPGIADGYLLPAYAAAFLSTVILSNGRFHMWGTITGGLAVVYISQGLVTGGVSYTWTDLINGLVLIVAVAMSTTLRRRLLR